MEMTDIRELAERIRRNVAKVIVGKDDVIELILISLIAGGHVLLEDVPGTGKTLLAKSIARSLSCTFKRVQFTPDLLPSDISGINFYSQKSGEFEFHPGPLFSHILLADEINRATPRTQSSLLEAMEERQVSVDGETRRLEAPFLVLATQNPVENQGTFPLPEAQLDRFLLKISMGYPSTEESVTLLKRFKEQNPLEEIGAVATREELAEAQESYAKVAVSDDILRYLIQLVEKTRSHPDLLLGVSPRGSQAMLKAAQVLAILRGRDYVLPDDIKVLMKPLFGHRILLRNHVRAASGLAEQILDRIAADTPVPAESGIL